MNINQYAEQLEETSRLAAVDFGEFIRGLKCYGRVLYNGLISAICGCKDNGTGGAFLTGCAY